MANNRTQKVKTGRKLVKVSDRKAFLIEGVLLGEEQTPAVSVRQMYTTQKAPTRWMPSRKGFVVPLEHAARLARAIGMTSQEDPDTFVEIGGGDEE